MRSTSQQLRSLALALVAGTVLITCTGCQTFSLSAEDFQRQQSGQTVDRETGEAVAAAGTVGYFGTMIGKMAGAAFGK